jgi:hypothetical protein
MVLAPQSRLEGLRRLPSGHGGFSHLVKSTVEVQVPFGEFCSKRKLQVRKAKSIVKAPPEKALEALCVGREQIANQFHFAVPVTNFEVNEVVFAENKWLQAFQKYLSSLFRKLCQVRMGELVATRHHYNTVVCEVDIACIAAKFCVFEVFRETRCIGRIANINVCESRFCITFFHFN